MALAGFIIEVYIGASLGSRIRCLPSPTQGPINITSCVSGLWISNSCSYPGCIFISRIRFPPPKPLTLYPHPNIPPSLCSVRLWLWGQRMSDNSLKTFARCIACLSCIGNELAIQASSSQVTTASLCNSFILFLSVSQFLTPKEKVKSPPDFSISHESAWSSSHIHVLI